MWLWHPQRQHDNLQDVTFPKNYLPCAYELLKCNDLLFGRLLHCDYRYRFHPPCLLVSSWFHQSMLLTSWFSVTIHVWVSIQSSVILLIYAYMILCVYPYASLKRKHKVSRFNRHGLNKRTLGISAQVNHGNVFRFLSSGYIRISLISQW